jgi:hypothetical protein
MAARKQLFHPDVVKKKIQTSQLINRLQENALSAEETMTAGQIASANSLLDRVLPKMKAVEHSGEVGVTVIRKTVYETKP